MNTLHKILLSILIIISSQLHSQDLDGIWISSHEREIKSSNSTMILENDEYKEVLSDSIRYDTFFSEALLLLDFLSDKKVTLKGIYGGHEDCKYSQKGNIIKISTSFGKLKGIAQDNQLIFSQKVNNTLLSETYFKKLTQMDSVTSNTAIGSRFLANSMWSIKTDSSSYSFGIDLHFIDSNYVIISKAYGDYGFTHIGEYKVVSYKEHYFLGFNDMEELETRLYHITNFEDTIIYAESYEHYHFTKKEPPLKNIELVKKKFLSSQYVTDIEDKLIGEWSATNNPIPVGCDTLINQKYILIFHPDKRFEINISGTIIGAENSFEGQKKINGTWKVSETGKYIDFKLDDGWSQYASLINLSSDNLSILFRVESLNCNTISDTIIKLER